MLNLNSYKITQEITFVTEIMHRNVLQDFLTWEFVSIVVSQKTDWDCTLFGWKTNILDAYY